MTEKTAAQRLADALEAYGPRPWANTAHLAAAELRRLHEANQALLEALKELVQVSAHLDACQATVEQARAAIAKAQGEIK